jgi:CPA1 family monovalent cation:H+ antiporter
MFSPIALLSALILLMIAGIVSLVTQKNTLVPYTVVLVIVGIILGYVSKIPGLSFITLFELTPQLLFYVFLPTLIFEAAYNVSLKKFYKSFFSISLLSTVGLIVASFVVAFLGKVSLGLLGIDIPFLPLLLFGAIISATDPVGVLSLFKSLGAPKKLSLMFEGESLFNDATAVALFLSLLAILTKGESLGTASFYSVSLMFVTMLGFGIVLGLIMGKFFSWLIQLSKNNELVTLLFMLVMAHTTFLLSEILNEYLMGIGLAIGISPIIATTIASMELGNDGGLAIPLKIKNFVHHFWTQISFFVNSIIFLLVGILVVQQNIFSAELIIPTLVGITVVFISRAISVYPLLTLIGWLKLEEKIPHSWRVLMSWASIRGALSIIIVLTIPEDLFVAGWTLSVSPHDLILSLTLGVVLASLLGKMLSVPFIMKKLGILELDPSERIMLSETQRFVNILKFKKLESSHQKGYVNDYSFKSLSNNLKIEIESCPLGDSHIFNNIIQHYALGVEKFHLEQLYSRNEINTSLFIRLYTKIDGQELDIEHRACGDNTITSNAFLKKKIDTYEKQSSISVHSLPLEERFLYYRALCITARKVVKDLHQKDFPESYRKQVEKVIERYTQYKNRNQDKMLQLENDNKEVIHGLLKDMGSHMLFDYQEKVLDELVETHFTTERVRAHLGKN